jgi:hypothetical protein
MDFIEINHDIFRKLILELKNRQKIITMEPRTNPQFYILNEWRDRYPTMSENNRVKPKLTGDDGGQHKQDEMLYWLGERLTSKTQAYSTKPVHKKQGSRPLKGTPASAPYAQNAAQPGSTATDSDI